MTTKKLALVSLLLIGVFTQSGQGATTDPYSFRSNIVLTGDYVLTGGPMNGTTSNGYTTTTITIPQLPPAATAVAAYLYWGAVVHQSNLAAGMDASFQAGGDSVAHSVTALTKVLNPNGTAPCGSGGGAAGNGSGAHQFILHEADVLRFLKVGQDGRFVLNNTYTVRIRDDGGNAVRPLGASLLMVYRDVNNPSLSAIAIYGGGVQVNQAN